MDLRLNRQSQLPIHVQLKAQLAHLIQAGQLAPGAQLPTVRQLAGFLRINRNTVARVFADLEREGYLSCEPGRGTFVSTPKAEARNAQVQALLAVVDEAMERASRLGFSPAEFSAVLYARAQAAPALPSPPVPALFVECNRPQLELFSGELREALPLRLDALLVKDLERLLRRRPAAVRAYTLAVTTFFHVHEVRRLLAGSGLEVVGLLAEASLETLMRLTALPEGSKVGIACHEWSGTENLRLSIRNAGLTHIELVPACARDTGSLRRMVETATVVVCSSLAERKIRAMAPRATEIIVDDRRLDPAGIAMLRRRLLELQAAATAPARPAPPATRAPVEVRRLARPGRARERQGG